jgi:hypothetical protein
MKKSRALKNKTIKNILSALAIAIFGFILLNITFLFDAAYQALVRGFVEGFFNLGPESNLYWFPPLLHISFVIIILLISWFVLKSKLKAIYKAIYMTVPVATIFVTIGMFFYQWPFVVYSLSILFGLGVLYYFYRTKRSWIFYYTLILIGLVMLLMALTGMEI